MDFWIVTNNERVREKYATCHIVFVDGTDRDVMVRLRDLVHAGHILLTHPLTGSLKPGETPFRSVLVTDAPTEKVDTFSLQLIETCRLALDKFRIRYEGLSISTLDDFREVDLSLIDSAIPRAMADRSRGRFE